MSNESHIESRGGPAFKSSRYYGSKEGLPHEQDSTPREGCKRGVCRQTNDWEYNRPLPFENVKSRAARARVNFVLHHEFGAGLGVGTIRTNQKPKEGKARYWHVTWMRALAPDTTVGII
jgi:hypothetical protein